MPYAPTGRFIHTFHGFWTPGARCGVTTYLPRAPEKPLAPVVVFTELPDNDNTSITNAIEQVTAEICQQFWAPLLRAWSPGQPAPVVVIEHYPADPDYPHEPMLGMDRYAVVDFSSWNVGRRFRSGRESASFGTPSWRHVTHEQIVSEYGIEPPSTPLRQKPCIRSER